MGAAVMVTATTDRAGGAGGELRASGADADGVAADLTDPASAQRTVDAATARWGRLDVVVNNAGMTSVAGPQPEDGALAQMSLRTWHAGLRRNLDTAFLVTRAAVPAMTPDWGRVVMVSSVTGS